MYQVFCEMGIAISDSDGDPEEGDDPEDQVGNTEAVDTEAVDTEAVDTFSLDDPIRMYLTEIGRIALLRKEREIEYAQLGDEAARDKLTEANLCLVTEEAGPVSTSVRDAP